MGIFGTEDAPPATHAATALVVDQWPARLSPWCSWLGKGAGVEGGGGGTCIGSAAGPLTGVSTCLPFLVLNHSRGGLAEVAYHLHFLPKDTMTIKISHVG